MIIVAPAERDAYLADRIGVIAHTRSTPGCLDFSLTADALQPGRVNVYERWESDAQLLAFRSGAAGAGPEPGPWPKLLGAAVAKYRIAVVEAP